MIHTIRKWLAKRIAPPSHSAYEELKDAVALWGEYENLLRQGLCEIRVVEHHPSALRDLRFVVFEDERKRKIFHISRRTPHLLGRGRAEFVNVIDYIVDALEKEPIKALHVGRQQRSEG